MPFRVEKLTDTRGSPPSGTNNDTSGEAKVDIPLFVRQTNRRKQKKGQEGEGEQEDGGDQRSCLVSFEGSRAHSPEDENGRFGHDGVAVVLVLGCWI